MFSEEDQSSSDLDIPDFYWDNEMKTQMQFLYGYLGPKAKAGTPLNPVEIHLVDTELKTAMV